MNNLPFFSRIRGQLLVLLSHTHLNINAKKCFWKNYVSTLNFHKTFLKRLLLIIKHIRRLLSKSLLNLNCKCIQKNNKFDAHLWTVKYISIHTKKDNLFQVFRHKEKQITQSNVSPDFNRYLSIYYMQLFCRDLRVLKDKILITLRRYYGFSL